MIMILSTQHALAETMALDFESVTAPTATQTKAKAKAEAKLAKRPSGEGNIASCYWQPQPLASGGRFNPKAMSAAHKTLPFGTKLKVTNVRNGKSVVVVINDRGPYVKGRVLDLSDAACRSFGVNRSITKIRYEIIGQVSKAELASYRLGSPSHVAKSGSKKSTR